MNHSQILEWADCLQQILAIGFFSFIVVAIWAAALCYQDETIPKNLKKAGYMSALLIAASGLGNLIIGGDQIWSILIITFGFLCFVGWGVIPPPPKTESKTLN